MGTKPSYVAVVAGIVGRGKEAESSPIDDDIIIKDEDVQINHDGPFPINVPSSSRFRALQELEVGVEDATPPSVQIGGQGPRSTPKPCSPSSKVVNSNGLALRSKAGHHHLISDNGAPSSVYVISLKEGDVPNVSINKLNFIFGLHMAKTYSDSVKRSFKTKHQPYLCSSSRPPLISSNNGLHMIGVQKVNSSDLDLGGKGGNFLNVDFNCPHSSSPIAVTSPSCDKENQAYVA
ncbi:hypothetical protein V6N11_018539 [Hibiscus sabdariffa]|uniref:Uncharacterized protein n=1 Tax=Hibiscus sabdariffa TaxID=183260 RepID=A0ABR2T7P4_9ROSI